MARWIILVSFDRMLTPLKPSSLSLFFPNLGITITPGPIDRSINHPACQLFKPATPSPPMSSSRKPAHKPTRPLIIYIYSILTPHQRSSYVPWTEDKGDITSCGIPQNYNASKEWADKKVGLFAVPGMVFFFFLLAE